MHEDLTIEFHGFNVFGHIDGISSGKRSIIKAWTDYSKCDVNSLSQDWIGELQFETDASIDPATKNTTLRWWLAKISSLGKNTYYVGFYSNKMVLDSSVGTRRVFIKVK